MAILDGPFLLLRFFSPAVQALDRARGRAARRDNLLVKDWPAWATERVDVQPYDPAWRQRGDQERQLLEVSLAPWLVARVEHVGSTAVPGLAAKPILDLQAAVADLRCAPRIASSLAPANWHYVAPDLDDRPWRRFFVKVIDGHRVAHLHLMTRDNSRWDEQLAFRDGLRADRKLVESYAALKRTLAAQHAEDREAYTAAKTDFILAVLKRGVAGDCTGHRSAP